MLQVCYKFCFLVELGNISKKEEFDLIRAELPDWVKELNLKSEVLGEDGYIFTDNEK